MRRMLKEMFMLCIACTVVGYISYGQQSVKFQDVKFRQVMRLPIGSQEGQLFVKVHPNRMVVAPRLLPPDADGNFWIMGEAKGGIIRVKRTGEIVTILRQFSYSFLSVKVNSSGHLAIHVRKREGYNYTDEVQIYNPAGKRLAAFTVKGCPQCKHPYLHYLAGIDDQQRVWLQFLSTDRTVEEEPKRSACIAAFNSKGELVYHIPGVWEVSVGRLWRRTNGSYIVLDPDTMKAIEIPVPVGWDGFFIEIDITRNLIWWYCWRHDNPNVRALMAFSKQGITAILSRPNKFLGTERGQEVLSYEVRIDADGRLYIAQCTKEAFYIFEADMSFLKQ